MAAKRSKRRSPRTPSSPAEVVEITKITRPVIERKTRIVGRTEPATLSRAISEPVVWDVEVEAPVEITRKKVPAPIKPSSKKGKRIKRAS
jgi:hypothetical protein